jgi:predicted alpha/beta-fold hydrolase
VPDAPPLPFVRQPKSLLELDNKFTGPINGFGDAATYYRECSSARFVPEIRKPTFILTAADDPLIPVEMFSRLEVPQAVRVAIASGGGHLGFIAHRKFSQAQGDPDNRWMDWRILEWFANATPMKPIARAAQIR